LPAVEGGSIILKNQLEAFVLHGVHARKVGRVQALSSEGKKVELEPSKRAVDWARGRRFVAKSTTKSTTKTTTRTST